MVANIVCASLCRRVIIRENPQEVSEYIAEYIISTSSLSAATSIDVAPYIYTLSTCV